VCFAQATSDRAIAPVIARYEGNPVDRKQRRGLRGGWGAVIHNRCELFSALNLVSERIEWPTLVTMKLRFGS
jgi:hypothetical protein